jgi:hypothetical protein
MPASVPASLAFFDPAFFWPVGLILGHYTSIRRSALKAFDLLLTTDKNMRYQQNLTGRRIVIVVLGQQQWPQLRPHIQRVVEAV